ncbi:hypothetical protein [Rhizobium azibense]|uniref:Uncharacterized protein n=1 Tax=Rhizobium azibense TaxID=1136135 RepID=A0A4R3RIA0_9HYPH|nr:hypothetical protein [Rhizobium azibense]TCU35423.1 hypothetical protein EV129_10913 [Rhizobium azibense]
MICDPFKPSTAIIDFRKRFTRLFQPGRHVTASAFADAIAGLNTCVEMAREYEDEMMVLESMLLPNQPRVVYGADFVSEPTPRPALRLVVSNRGERA